MRSLSFYGMNMWIIIPKWLYGEGCFTLQMDKSCFASFPFTAIICDLCFIRWAYLLLSPRVHQCVSLSICRAWKRKVCQTWVKAAHFNGLHDKCNTDSREHRAVAQEHSPSWRPWYRRPLSNRSNDFWWMVCCWVLHTFSVNSLDFHGFSFWWYAFSFVWG